MTLLYDVDHNILINSDHVTFYSIVKDVKETNKWVICATLVGVGKVPLEFADSEDDAKERLETYRQMIKGKHDIGKKLNA